MSPEERQLLQGLFDRMRPNASNFRDREAEQLILDNIRQQPYAPYLLAQTVIVQDQALQAANERLQHLEQQLQEQQQAPQQGGGFLSSLFGGGASHQAPPVAPQRPVWNQGAGYPPASGGYPPQGGAYPPQGGAYPPQGNYPPQGGYPPPQQGGPWGGAAPQSGGGGFLRGALGTAAGVAGGVLAADAIGSLFRSGQAGGGLGIAQGVPGFGEGGGETVVNNYYGDSGQANAQQDAAQDASDYGVDPTQAQDDAQDMSDYGYDDGTTDV